MLAWAEADGVHVAEGVPDLRAAVPSCAPAAGRSASSGPCAWPASGAAAWCACVCASSAARTGSTPAWRVNTP